MVNQRKILLLITCSFLLFLTGCWDQVDIEKRGFIVGTAIDLADEKKNGEYVLTITNQFVVPAGLGAPTQGGGDQKAYSNLSASGESIYVIDREMAQLTSRKPFFEHLKVVIVSSEIAKIPNLFAEVMDIFLRNPEMRRSIKIVVADGKAKDVLEVKPETEKLPAMYLDSIMENSIKSSAVLESVVIGEVHNFLLNNMSYTIPRVVSRDKRIDYDGAAVFQGNDNKMVGTLNGKETEGLNFITAKGKEGAIKIKLDDDLLAYEIEDMQSSIKIDAKDIRNPKVSVTIDLEGTLAETFGTVSILRKKRLAEIEKQVAKKVEKIAKHTIKVAQEDLQADIFGIGDKLKRLHYDQWQKVKNDWDHGANYFANCTFQVDANAEIRSVGSTNQSKNK